MRNRWRLACVLVSCALLFVLLIAGVEVKNQRITIGKLEDSRNLLYGRIAYQDTTYATLNQAYEIVKADAYSWEGKYEIAQSNYLALLNNPVVVEVERVVEKPVYPQRFESVLIAKEWLFSHTLPVVLMPDRSGRISLTNIRHDPRYDCDDYADDYEALALLEGISLWQVPLYNGCIWGIKVSEIPGLHVGLWTKIGNSYYYIEPVPLDNKWKFIKIVDAD